MSHWNHRIIKLKAQDGAELVDNYAVHEVYYNDDGTIYAYTNNPVRAYGDTLEELRETLNHMLKSLDAPVLEQPIKCVDYRDD